MSRRSLGTLIAGLALVLAACSSSGSSPAASSPAASSPAASAASAAGPSAAAPSATTSAAAGTCSETKDAGAVAVSIKDFEFDPAAITAKVGQVVAFSNTGVEPHNATLDARRLRDGHPADQSGATGWSSRRPARTRSTAPSTPR